jgi:hypothetical protein
MGIMMMPACSSGGPEGNKEIAATDSEVIVAANVVPLSGATEENLLRVDNDTYYFKPEAIEALKSVGPNQALDGEDALQTGNIIVGSADGGFMRVITDVNEENGVVAVSTDQATLEDVFVQTGEVDFTTGVDEEAVTSVDQYALELNVEDNGSTIDQAILQGLKINRNGFTYDKDLDFTFRDKILQDPVTGSALWIAGDVGVTPALNFSTNIKWFKMKSLKFDVSGTIDANLSLIADGKLGASSGNLPIANFKFAPIVIMVGPVPLTFVPRINLYYGAEAYVQGVTTLTAHQIYSFDMGAEFNGSNWNEIKSFSSTPISFTRDIYVGADGRVWLTAEFGLQMMSAANLSVDATPYSRFHWDPFTAPNWNVFAGFDSNVNFNIKLLGFKLYDWNHDIWSKEWLIYQS